MEKIKRFIQKYQMFDKKDVVIAGISGGADSVCLFLLLLNLRQELGIPFIAVHVNHGLRGGAAKRDECFVEELCSTYEVPFERICVQLELIAKKRKQSLEEAGRNVRREAFEEMCRKYGGTKIALAHHQNDNAETFLWNLSRGSGLKGMGGIRPVNGKFVRPLLCLERKEIEAYLRKWNQTFCEDETNAETVYVRNRLRHKVLPVLVQEINTHAVRHINEAMEEVRELEDYMNERTEEAVRECVENKIDEAPVIYKEKLEKYPAVLRRMVVRKVWENLTGTLQNLEKCHTESALELFEKQVGKETALPGKWKALRVYEGVQILNCEYSTERRFYTTRLCIPGETEIKERGIHISTAVFTKTEGFSLKEIPQKTYTKWFDYDIILYYCSEGECSGISGEMCTERELCVRSRQSGDRIAVDKAGHRKKLKTWFVDEKIPAKQRDSIPCIACGQEILWILGYRMSSAFQISDTTKHILQVEVTFDNKTNK